MGFISNLMGALFPKNKGLNRDPGSHIGAYDMFFPTNAEPVSSRENATYMSACDTHARQIEKCLPVVYLGDVPAANRKTLNEILQLEPNMAMSAPVFWKTIGLEYFRDGLAIAWIERDYESIGYQTTVRALWPLDLDNNQLEVRTASDGQIIVSFFINGKKQYASADDLLIWARNVDPSNLFGRRNVAIEKVISTIQTNYAGIEQAIKMSSFVRFLLVGKTVMTPEEQEKRAKAFADAYMAAGKGTGVAYVDGSATATQVTGEGKYAQSAVIKELKDDVYSYLGTNQKIVQGTFNEDEWQSYYEGTLEPFFREVSVELTRKLFSPAEINRGNRIVIESSWIQTATLKTRIEMAKVIQTLPVYRPNTVMELLFMPPMVYGDKEYMNLNYTEASKASAYQGTSKAPAEKPNGKPGAPKQDPDGKDDDNDEDPPADVDPQEDK